MGLEVLDEMTNTGKCKWTQTQTQPSAYTCKRRNQGLAPFPTCRLTSVTGVGRFFLHVSICRIILLPLPPKVKEVMFSSVCLFVTCKIEDFSSILVSRFCYSVCLSVCQSPIGHKLKLIFTVLIKTKL